jgi:acyl carrier protein
MTEIEISDILKNEVARETGLPLSTISDEAEFFELGLDSISCIYVLDRVEKKIGVELNPLYFFDHPTISSLARFITTLKNE